MNLQEAKARATELTAKMSNGETLTPQEAADLTKCNLAMQNALDPQGKFKAAGRRINDAFEGTKTGMFSNPSVVLAGKVIGILTVAALSAFGGMKYEQRRSGRRGQSMFDLSTSPQSHPATSPEDGRLAANRSETTVPHTAPRRASATA